MESDKIVFKMNCTLKHNRLGDRLDTLTLKEFPACRRLCVVRTIKEYLRRTDTLRSSYQLLVNFVRPYGAISRDKLARWTLKERVGAVLTRLSMEDTPQEGPPHRRPNG